jgi:hypothetical protein
MIPILPTLAEQRRDTNIGALHVHDAEIVGRELVSDAIYKGDSNVATITMAAMAADGVRSRSLPFARRTRSRCKQQVSANRRERARTPANPCHAEGRGFESLHPL